MLSPHAHLVSRHGIMKPHLVYLRVTIRQSGSTGAPFSSLAIQLQGIEAMRTIRIADPASSSPSLPDLVH